MSPEIKNRVLRTARSLSLMFIPRFMGHPHNLIFAFWGQQICWLQFFGGTTSQYIGLSVRLSVCQFQLALSSKMTGSTHSASTTTFVILVNSVNDKVTWSITFLHINIWNLFQKFWLCKIQGQDTQIFEEIVIILNIICIIGHQTSIVTLALAKNTMVYPS